MHSEDATCKVMEAEECRCSRHGKAIQGPRNSTTDTTCVVDWHCPNSTCYENPDSGDDNQAYCIVSDPAAMGYEARHYTAGRRYCFEHHAHEEQQFARTSADDKTCVAMTKQMCRTSGHTAQSTNYHNIVKSYEERSLYCRDLQDYECKCDDGMAVKNERDGEHSQKCKNQHHCPGYSEW